MLKKLVRALLRRAGESGSASADAEIVVAPDRLHVCTARAAEHAAAGGHAAAAQLYRESLELQPQDARVWCNLGAELGAIGQADEAERVYRRALELDPALAEAWYNLGRLLQEQGRVAEPENCYRAAAALVDAGANQPLWQLIYNNWGLLLYNQGRPQEAVALYRDALVLHAQASDLGSNLLFTLNSLPGLDPEAVTAEHLAWGARHADRFAPAQAEFANSAEPHRTVRVGYVSADFRRHAVAFYMEPVLRKHRRDRFEVYCYSNWAKPDDVTEQFRGLCDRWRDIAGVDDAMAAQMVRDDRIDILVDLSGHTEGNRLLLFARKPAPIQVTYMGYLGTSGMAAMDLRITDPHIDPVGVAEPLYRERLLRLPHGIICYQPPPDAPQVPALPALQRGHVTFGSFNSFPKLTEATQRVWARLLARLPGARLRVVSAPAGEACDRMLAIFESEGVFANRIDVLGRMPYRAYLEQYLQVDIALDPYPYNGGTTTLESLWMGVPVISRAGLAGFSRCGASHLSNVGLDNLIAGSWEEYTDIALRLAGDLPRLAALRAGLRARMRDSPLLDASGFAAGLEALYRQAWQEWCAGKARGGQAC